MDGGSGGEEGGAAGRTGAIKHHAFGPHVPLMDKALRKGAEGDGVQKSLPVLCDHPRLTPSPVPGGLSEP